MEIKIEFDQAAKTIPDTGIGIRERDFCGISTARVIPTPENSTPK
jgi:hypothetical protein